MLYRTITLLVCCLLGMTASASAQSALLPFYNKNLNDWVFHTNKENVKVNDVFSFTEEGTLLCTGEPFGYLATKESYKNFKLSLDWRWRGEKPTNSGIFLKITDQPEGAFLPKTYEVQLHHTNVGDVWAFYGRTMTDSPDRLKNVESQGIGKYSGVKKIIDMEKIITRDPKADDIYAWNTMEILCHEALIVVTVNGKIVNWTTGAEAIEGRIGFQSEGGPIEFRNAILTPLP